MQPIHTTMIKALSVILFLGLFVLKILPCSAQAYERKNICPIILVHGFAGWGPDELNGYLYWGGVFDIQKFLRDLGYEVYTAHVGPYSSNWDRAIELYYQIKGGQVDYGPKHCAIYGHIQKPDGKSYPNPLYPQWDAQHPVHLIGHSMGGQTIRMLSALLAGKNEQFQNVLCTTDNSPFIPGEGWIKSMTTISAPHNGASLFDLTNPVRIMDTFAQVVGIEGSEFIPDDFYNVDLEQWDIHKQDKEPMEAYIRRIVETLGDTMDFSIRELTTIGAERFNSMVNTTTEDSLAFRFSIANEETVREPYPDGMVYVPDLKMNPAFLQNALIIGASPLFTDHINAGIQWRENDGIVNTASMKAPLAGCTDTYVEYDGTARRDVWNYMGTMHWDHLDILGHTQMIPFEHKQIILFYAALAELLCSLE
jgi:triacylglycerol lipase